MTRDMTATTFVVCGSYTLLHRHPKLGLILPPGGHLEENETPDAAAVREVREETGLEIGLLSGGSGQPPEALEALTTPLGVLLEDIAPGHQHIDLLYIGVPLHREHGDGEASYPQLPVAGGFSWYHLRELDDEALPPSVRYYGALAVEHAWERCEHRFAYSSPKGNNEWKRSRS
jgi:8-oxo-dGTP pyrophosphatase MutT (NUDIX family)